MRRNLEGVHLSRQQHLHSDREVMTMETSLEGGRELDEAENGSLDTTEIL